MKRVTPAVVNVYAARIVENRVPLYDDPVFRRLFGGSGPREQVQRSLGSGVVVELSHLKSGRAAVDEDGQDSSS
jgi:S1-C subfamily serine protease